MTSRHLPQHATERLGNFGLPCRLSPCPWNDMFRSTGRSKRRLTAMRVLQVRRCLARHPSTLRHSVGMQLSEEETRTRIDEPHSVPWHRLVCSRNRKVPDYFRLQRVDRTSVGATQTFL